MLIVPYSFHLWTTFSYPNSVLFTYLARIEIKLFSASFLYINFLLLNLLDIFIIY
jgi:hypothetical protein